MVPDDFVTGTEGYDLMKGTAGTLLGLLSYYDRSRGTDVLDLAIRCGDHLLNHRTSIEGEEVWFMMGETTATTGIAHGSDGCGYALARLSEVTGERRFAKAAKTAFEFDPDQASVQEHAIPGVGEREWCWGPAGKLLARIGASRAVRDESMLRDTDELVATLATSELSPYDHLCCGNFGRIESLLVASRTINSDSTHARDLAG